MSILDTISDLVSNFNKYRTTADMVFKTINWLRHYGYLAKEGELTPQDVVEAIKKVQEIIGILVVDGQLGPKTYNAIFTIPRCGHTDHAMLTQSASVRAWGIKNLNYFIAARDSDLNAQLWDSIIADSLNAWSEVADLKFSRVNSADAANLVFSTGRGSRDQFDGPGQTLAWAQLPFRSNFRGQLLCRFDVDENWTQFGAGRGIYLRNVATHEIGHLLGLEHSSKSNALMAPFYSSSIRDPQANDDIPRIVNLYGQAKVKPTPAPQPEPEPQPTANVPSNTVATYDAENNRVVIEWEDNSNGEDGFEIYRNDVLIGLVPRGYTAAIDRDIKDGQIYTYKVRAKFAETYSEFSNSSTVSISNEEPDPEPNQEELTILITGQNLKVKSVS